MKEMGKTLRWINESRVPRIKVRRWSCWIILVFVKQLWSIILAVSWPQPWWIIRRERKFRRAPSPEHQLAFTWSLKCSSFNTFADSVISRQTLIFAGRRVAERYLVRNRSEYLNEFICAYTGLFEAASARRRLRHLSFSRTILRERDAMKIVGRGRRVVACPVLLSDEDRQCIAFAARLMRTHDARVASRSHRSFCLSVTRDIKTWRKPSWRDRRADNFADILRACGRDFGILWKMVHAPDPTAARGSLLSAINKIRGPRWALRNWWLRGKTFREIFGGNIKVTVSYRFSASGLQNFKIRISLL